jgi:pimeloyl-ACP methyl ester carboxylesterase
VTITLLGLAFGGTLARADSDIGVVLMHGKQSQPGSPPGLSQIAERLRAAGIKVIAPQMPWSAGQWEHIDVTVEQAFALIDGYVAQLRAQGASRIVIAGHSLGANMALSYAVARGNVAAVVMLSPGHAPGFFFSKSPEFRNALAKAHALVEGGQGAQPFSGPDDNQGRSVTLSTTAAIYYSWMSPMGMASMNQQAPLLAASIPVMTVMGKSENALANIQATVYQPAAKNPYSIFVAVSGDHRSAAEAAVIDTVSWVRNLPQ